MTLVVGAQNAFYATQISDRRLTLANGTVADDESNKLIIFDSDHCRFIVGFAGLAGDGLSFRTCEWLAQTLRAVATPDYDPLLTLNRLRDAATTKFKMPSLAHLASNIRRTSFMFTGFVYSTDGPRVTYAIVTNFQDYAARVDSAESWDEFRTWFRVIPTDHPPIWAVQRIGAWGAMTISKTSVLSNLLSENRPAQAVIGKTIELIREISGPPGSTSTVGRQLMSAVIASEATQPAHFSYHTDVETHTYHAPTMVVAKRTIGQMVFSNATLTKVGPAPTPLLFPQQRRNQPCRCGSGKKFKLCHGGRS